MRCTYCSLFPYLEGVFVRLWPVSHERFFESTGLTPMETFHRGTITAVSDVYRLI
jgi:hypothetical protein